MLWCIWSWEYVCTCATCTLSDEVIHEGRCIKESGTAFLGKTNWRKRWFKLVKRGNTTLLQYFK